MKYFQYISEAIVGMGIVQKSNEWVMICQTYLLISLEYSNLSNRNLKMGGEGRERENEGTKERLLLSS